IIKLSTRPEKRVGSDEVWDKSEKALEEALNAKNLDWDLQPGEGAFYGPKIEFSLKDCLERVWQCGTIQVDFSMPERLDAQYIAEDGSRQSPVMLHRAILGSLERFIGILIEEFAGKFPVWLAPTQVVLMSITDKNNDYVASIAKILQKQGIRVKIDLRNEKIGFKIREHTLKRIPYLVVIGDKEVESNELAVRSLSGKNMGNFTPEDFMALLAKNIAERSKLEP
ncbi:MAG: threonine--tRNA ligase, partial [Piscirickettsiaceae bacterium]